MSVFKHKKGYYGYNFMYNGKRYCRSFKGLEKDEVAKLETVHKSELIKSNYDITKKVTYYLDDIIDDYKKYVELHYTIPDGFNYVIERFRKLIGNKDIEQIVAMDIEKYISARHNEVKNSTINREMDNIRRIFSLAVENKKLKVSPCATIKDLRIDNPPERYLTKDEEIKLLSVCNPTMRAIIICALHTGARQQEILSLTWDDIFFDCNYLIVRNTKNNKPRKLPLTKTLKDELLKLPRYSNYVFTSPVTLSKYKDVKTSFSRAVKRANIPHISFHKLRHSTASRLNEQGVDIVTIQKILDHADIRTTMRYTHNATKSIENAFSVLDEY